MDGMLAYQVRYPVYKLKIYLSRASQRGRLPPHPLHIWTALRPDASEQQVRVAVLPVIRHVVLDLPRDDRKATVDADRGVAPPHCAIAQAGTLALDVTRLIVDYRRRMNINEVIAVQPLHSIEIAVHLRCVTRVLGPR